MERLTLDPKQTENVIASLGACPLFRALKTETLSQIMTVAEVYRYEPEEVLIRQGDPSDSFFIVAAGEVSVRVAKDGGDSSEIGRMPARSSVGEVGLLLNEPRTATIVAVDDVMAVKFGAQAFNSMYQKIPNFGLAVSQGIAFRLQQVSGKGPSLPSLDTTKPVSREVLGMLPIELCQRHRVLAMAVDGNILTLGFVDVPSTPVLTAVREHLPGMTVRPAHIGVDYFNEIMRAHAGIRGWAVSEAEAAVEKPESKSPRLDAMLERMVAEGASDLHLSAGQRPYWRIDGDIKSIVDAPVIGREHVLELFEPVMEKRHIEEFERECDADFAYAVPGLGRFRVNIFRDSNGIGAAVRLIPSKVMTVEQLGLPDVVNSFCEIPKGLVLVTGPTGSGKSTTLAAMIDHIIKTRKAHIVTIEDPIEFVHKSDQCLINQREVGGHTRSFARALHAVLREDPDIVLLGEMRDPETIAMALETANTGHLVLATLHTNTAITAIDRLIEQFPSEQQMQIRSTLGDVLRGVVAQTLCKKVEGGRMAVVEVMVVNLAISNLIREGKVNQISNIMVTSRGSGMTMMNDELARLVEARRIELPEALSKAIDKDDLTRRFKSGLSIAEDPPTFERFRIVAVKPKSPAMEAGLQRGDYLLEINGKQAKDLTVEEGRVAFRSEMMHQLLIERAGKKVKMQLDLKKQ